MSSAQSRRADASAAAASLPGLTSVSTTAYLYRRSLHALCIFRRRNRSAHGQPPYIAESGSMKG